MSLRASMEALCLAEPDATAEELAEKFLARVTKRELLPILKAEFWRLRRDAIRTIESRAVARVAAGPQPVRAERGVAYERDIEGLRDLLDKPYRWRGEDQRLLRYMTREEHQARLDMLLAHRDGLDTSIELHHDAIRLIEAAGVTCLDDLDVLPMEVAA